MRISFCAGGGLCLRFAAWRHTHSALSGVDSMLTKDSIFLPLNLPPSLSLSLFRPYSPSDSLSLRCFPSVSLYGPSHGLRLSSVIYSGREYGQNFSVTSCVLRRHCLYDISVCAGPLPPEESDDSQTFSTGTVDVSSLDGGAKKHDGYYHPSTELISCTKKRTHAAIPNSDIGRIIKRLRCLA